VAPLQVPAEKLADGVAHGVLQSAGAFTVTALVQPAPKAAVIVTFIPVGIPVMVLPLTVPAVAVIVDPAVAENTTLYTPPPLHTPLPAVRPGGVQPGVPGQLVGLATTAMVVPQPLVDVAVSVTSVPVGISVTVLPLTVPADAVTMPLLLNVTLYVPAPLHTALPAVNTGAAVDGGLMVLYCTEQPGSLVIASSVVPAVIPLMVPLVLPAPPPVTVPVVAVTVELLVFTKFTL
jgi:hypothetical protein